VSQGDLSLYSGKKCTVSLWFPVNVKSVQEFKETKIGDVYFKRVHVFSKYSLVYVISLANAEKLGNTLFDLQTNQGLY